MGERAERVIARLPAAARTFAWTVLLSVGCVAGALASCEFNLEVVGTNFTYSHNDTWPYVQFPDAPPAVRDSIHAESLRPVYERFATALREATRLYRQVSAESPMHQRFVEKPLAVRSGQGRVRYWVSDPWKAWVDSLATSDVGQSEFLYAVRIGAQATLPRAMARVDSLHSLRRPPQLEAPDPKAHADWMYATCGGPARPRLFVLRMGEGKQIQARVLHGLFIDRRDAERARADIQSTFHLSTYIVQIPITPDLVRIVLEQQPGE
jgi:hypothetical protein